MATWPPLWSCQDLTQQMPQLVQVIAAPEAASSFAWLQMPVTVFGALLAVWLAHRFEKKRDHERALTESRRVRLEVLADALSQCSTDASKALNAIWSASKFKPFDALLSFNQLSAIAGVSFPQQLGEPAEMIRILSMKFMQAVNKANRESREDRLQNAQAVDTGKVRPLHWSLLEMMQHFRELLAEIARVNDDGAFRSGYRSALTEKSFPLFEDQLKALREKGVNVSAEPPKDSPFDDAQPFG